MKAKKLAKAFEVVSVPLDQIVDNPDQPRTTYDEEGIQGLAKSIENEGLLQPIAVKHLGKDKYEVEFGSRRVRAFRHLGRKEIPAIVLKEDESKIVSLLENIQREDLSVPDEARAFKRILDLTNLTQTQLAEKIGKDKSYVNRMAKLGVLVEEHIANGIAFTKLSKSTYLELLDTPGLLGKAESERWSEKKARFMVKNAGRGNKSSGFQEELEDRGPDKPVGSKSFSLRRMREDPEQWEPVEQTNEGFVIYPFRFLKNSKVNIELVIEKLTELQNGVDNILTTLRQYLGENSAIPEEFQVGLPFGDELR
jgi:ParB/RepB/Spo0J family partition protein